MKTILITGASSGIGLATSKQLLEEGHCVVGLARDFGKCDIDSELFHKISVDFSDLLSLPQKLQQLVKDYDRVDALVCCAGRGQFGSLEEFSYEQIQALLDLNFTSQAYVTRAVVPLMKKNARGDIVFIASEAALSGSRKGSIYCASKFALRGFAQALRDESSKSGIHVTVINPGMVNTAFFDELDFRPGEEVENYVEAADVAKTVCMVLSSRSGTVFDEINLSPLKKVIRHVKDA